VKYSRRDVLLTGAAALASASFPDVARVFARQGSDAVFRHGVASGDPLRDRVVLWTRVTPGEPGEVVDVGWMLARDARMSRVVASGSIRTSAERDYTVKLDAGALEPGTTYYYRFAARGARSPIGRTRTLPARPTRRIRLAVLSCSNYPFGFFNVYRRVAERPDLDMVLHLGDYIYEHANGSYGGRAEGDGRPLGRASRPDRELLTLDDYRTRYAQYREDPDLQAAHQRHPFIAIWDDHEFANNAWRGGAENHQAGEGAWETRRLAAARAWREWMPVRDVPGADFRVYRQFALGDLADLFMLDARLAGRDRQAAGGEAEEVERAARQLLGPAQEHWLLAGLRDSTAAGKPWQLLGQQVVMAPQAPPGRPSPSPDTWDGYRAARSRVFAAAEAAGVRHLVVLTGDAHSSWAYELAPDPFDPARYDPATGRGALGTEIVTPSVTSPPWPPPERLAKIRAALPHLRYADAEHHGYVVLDLTPEQLRAEWWYVPTVRERTGAERLGCAFVSEARRPHLIDASGSPSGPM
jgi:alkaline phosphatase D